MKLRTLLWVLAAIMLSLVWNYSWAQTAQVPYRAPLEQLQLPTGEEYVYGWQLMTGAERDFLQQRLRRAQSEEERRQIEASHHQQMQERAMQQGYALPEEQSMRHQSMRRHSMKKHRRGKPHLTN
jgi:serine phosphatase RsbU (regulator of sigma subunit)